MILCRGSLGIEDRLSIVTEPQSRMRLNVDMHIPGRREIPYGIGLKDGNCKIKH